MKPTVAEVILCLQKIVDSSISSNSEIYAASSAIRRPEMIHGMLSLKYQTDYPVWYYASLIIKNLAGVTADLRLYTVMVDDIHNVYVDQQGMIVVKDDTTVDIDWQKLDNIVEYSGGSIPWAYDWEITTSGDNEAFSVKIHAVFRTPSNSIPPNAVIH